MVRLKEIALASVLAFGIWIGLLSGTQVNAQQLINRSVMVFPAHPSELAAHNFQFTYASSSTIGSLVFEYCENSPIFTVSCTAPPGLDVTAAILSSMTGNPGFAIDNIHTTTNKIVLTRIGGPILAAPVVSTYDFTNITNPSTPNQTEFVRISTYATADASGPFTDNGAVAFATLGPFNVGAFVPPYLRFCVAIAVAPDCSTMSGDSIDLGVLSSTLASRAQSQFATGTNDSSGYVIYVLGTTMTSGNNIIPASSSPTPSFIGTSQFGINLRDNSNPDIGEEPFGVGTGVPYSNYGAPNFFMFNDGDPIATSAISSDFNRMTVSYDVNVSGAQPPGTYNSTLTYLATVQF